MGSLGFLETAQNICNLLSIIFMLKPRFLLHHVAWVVTSRMQQTDDVDNQPDTSEHGFNIHLQHTHLFILKGRYKDLTGMQIFIPKLNHSKL